MIFQVVSQNSAELSPIAVDAVLKIIDPSKENNVNLEDVNPEVRGFLSLDSLSSSLNGLSLSQSGSQSGFTQPGSQAGYPQSGGQSGYTGHGSVSPLSGPLSPPLPSPGSCSSPGQYQQAPGNNYPPRQPPVVYTAATFAQTKFGSTKLKTNSKKPNRMSPTEFSNYIKQRAIQKQQQNCHSQYQQQQSPFYDKYYSGNNSASWSSNPNSNYNNFPKSPGSSSLSNNDGFGFNNFGNNSSFGSSYGNQPNDYSSLLSEFSSDFDLDTNAFLQDILSNAGVGQGQGPAKANNLLGSPIRQNSAGGYDDWMSVGNVGNGLGYNANTLNDSLLGPDSRSSSTKSMSSGSESLPWSLSALN